MITKTLQRLITVLTLLFSTVHGYAQIEKEKLRDDIVAMANIGLCRAGAFLPNGKEVVFISNLSGSPQIWKIPATGGWPVQLTAFSDPVTAMRPSPKENLIAFQIAPGGGLNAQIYIMNSASGDMKQITKGGKTNNFLGTWSKDGALLSFGSNEQNTTGVDFFIYDTNKGNYELAVKNKGTGAIADFSAGNNQVLVTRLASRGNNDLYLFDLTTKEEKLLTQHEGPGTFFGEIDPSGMVYIGSNKDRDLIAFGKYSNNNIQILSERKDAELSGFTINNSGTTAALIWNENGRSKVTFFDLKRQKETKQLSLPIELVAGLSFSPNDQNIVFTGSGSREPSNIWIYSISNN
ncbi:MAG: WD40 repeat domain-containing protein, partial [Sediminibacterium sp.]|uniref:WD40 repeat domain-containing protein n=1 Tax=Sediminibacterium sp. TaxID=1917865 RepID=UPI00271A7A7C